MRFPIKCLKKTIKTLLAFYFLIGVFLVCFGIYLFTIFQFDIFPLTPFYEYSSVILGGIMVLISFIAFIGLGTKKTKVSLTM